MAGGYDKSCFWTILCVILTNKCVISLNQSIIAGDSYNLSSTNISLKKCCWKRIAQNSKDGNNCTDVINISWDVLKLFRLTTDDATSFPELNKVEQKGFSQDLLSCKDKNENNLHISVPVWGEFGTTIPPKKGFFSFFSQDGHFHYNEYAFSSEEYCIESVMSEVINVVACDYTSYCSKNSNSEEDKKPCLYRCCDYGEVWDISGTSIRCADSGYHKWKPPQYSDLNSLDLVTSEERDTYEEPVIFTYHPRDLKSVCKASFTVEISNPKLHENEVLRKKFGQHPFKVLANGTVWMKLRKKEWVELNPGEYCIDGFQLGAGTYSGNDGMDSLLFECKLLETVQELQGIQRQRTYSLSFGIIVSVCLIFLLMTMIVYILLWSKHNIHGWTVFSYITTLFITYLLLGATHFASIVLARGYQHGKDNILTFCGLLGILCHFSFLCTFSWSTVLSFDLFCTFRTLRPTRNGKSNGLKKFLFYCLFAFVVPTVIVTVGILLDITYSTDVLSDVITPEYGKDVCYVHPRYARVYFVILPISLLLAINFLLFCNTAYSVYTIKKSTQVASSSSTKKETDNQTLRLILKLLLVNGSVWVVEIISWYSQTSHDEVGPLSFILDVVNVMQAVAIFFLFVFKNDILESLRRKYPSLESAVNLAFKIKNCGNIQRSKENVATTTTDTSYKVKASKNMPVTAL